MRHRIVVLPGDGIGPEVVAAAVRTVEAAAGDKLELVQRPIGLAAVESHGHTMPPETMEAIADSAGVLLGPLTTHLYDIFDPNRPNPSGVLRKSLDLYANIRPARAVAGVPCMAPALDLVVVRENTEGFYADRNLLDGNGELRPTEDTVLSVRVVTRRACLRIARAGFALARARGAARKVTLVHKANVLRRGDGLFLECARQIAADFPDVRVEDLHVDAAAMQLILRPATFDVIVTANMFGDILSDEAAGLVGGLGTAGGLNVGDGFAMAQAVHGSAPDIAGRGIANPAAEILSAGMLLDWLGMRHADNSLREAARRIARAVDRTLGEAGVRTPDLGGRATTNELADAVLRAL